MEWKDKEQLQSHFDKHILGINNSDFEFEKALWEKYLFNNIEEINIKDYEDISIKNCNNKHYLYKDTCSNYYSINYYSRYDDNKVITSTRLWDRELKIFSCYFGSYINNYLNIYIFINDIIYLDKNNMLVKDFKNFDDGKLKELYLKVIKNINLNIPKYSAKYKITLLKLNMLIEHLNSLKHKEVINELLLNKLLSIKNNTKYNIVEDSIVYKNISQVKIMINNKEVYNNHKDEIDLLGEILNFISNKKICNIKNSRWSEMFNDFDALISGDIWKR